MVARLQKGEASGILCWKLDRLARNPVDGGQISWMLQQGVIQQIQTYGRSYYPTDNVLLMAVELGMANQYVRDLSINVKRGVRSKLAKGEPFGPVPEGYLNTPDRVKGEKCAVIDPERFPLVKKMWDMMLTGHYNPQQILKIANSEWSYKTLQRKKQGGKPLARSTIYRMFSNPFYYGMILYQKTGELYQGSYKPMITKDEFHRVQIILGSKGLKPASHTKEFAHTGQIRCAGCQCQITAEEKFRIKCTKCKQKFTHTYSANRASCPKCGTEIKDMKNPKTYHYVLYHCTKRKNTEVFRCSQSSISSKDLQDQFKKFLRTITIRQEYVEWGH
jgi:DNA invertase Pin-like site-specific DNA recombinase